MRQRRSLCAFSGVSTVAIDKGTQCPPISAGRLGLAWAASAVALGILGFFDTLIAWSIKRTVSSACILVGAR